jgi:hypothetical protein|nr:MAG TPA: Sporulation initiation factor Spo0A C terminal [Caudoviricetes sp.]
MGKLIIVPGIEQLEEAKKSIQTVADNAGKSYAEVYADMQEAILAGYNSPNPLVKRRWKRIACTGKVPTPEELIAWVALNVRK